MRALQTSFIIAGIAIPALLVWAQTSQVETFERGFRPHVAQGKIVGVQSSAQPQRKEFHISGLEYATWIKGESIESSPDWTPSQPAPLGFGQLEEIARQELAKIVTNDAPWSVTSFQLHSTPGRQALKWYFLVEMTPFWEPGPEGKNEDHDSFWVGIDFSGKPGSIGRRVGENQWTVRR